MLPRKIMLAVCAALCGLALQTGVRAQTDEHNFEVGGQFSVLNATNGQASVTTIVPCLVPPCPTVTTTVDGRATEPGFGARIGYNLTRDVTLEAEGNFFPRERALDDDEFNGGRKLQGLFGIKAGKRFESVGIFAKARPGFVNFDQGDLRLRPDILCVQIVPTPIGCFETRGRTDFAFDVGGVVELYPTARSIIRLDAGDTILRTGRHTVPVTVPNRGTFVVGVGSDTTHNFQGSVGVGVRF